MPEADDEIILQANQNNRFVKTAIEQIIDKRFTIGNNLGDDVIKNIKVVGIIFNEKVDENYSKIYVSDSKIEELTPFINKIYSNTYVLQNDNYIDAEIHPSENVEKGTAVVNESFGEVTNGEDLELKITNNYSNNETNFNIANTFSINNFQNYTGYSLYQFFSSGIFINKEDYDNLYNLPIYQSSVFVKNVEDIDKTISELETIGINSKRITDYKISSIKMNEQVLKIVKVLVTIALIIILLFISYFVIKIILKSRNTYYAILRMLGANYKTEKWILFVELLLVLSLAYLAVFIIIYLFKTNIITIKYISNLVKFINIKEFAFVYIIDLLIAGYISIKISKNMFKKTAINTFNEEVL